MFFDKRRIWALNLALLTILGFGATAVGQINTIPDSNSQTNLGGSSQIVGTVFGPSGKPAEKPVSVRLSTLTRGDRVAITNGTGNFAFRGLPTGAYTVSIDKEKEYEPFSEVVELRQFRGGPPQLYTMTIRLVLKGRPDIKPAVVNAEFANVPEATQKYYFEAVRMSGEGDRLGAIEQLKLALVEHPDFMYAYNELGVQYLRINRLQDADAAFQSALKIQPAAFSPLVNRGIAMVMMRRYGEAVPVLQKAAGVDPLSAVAHYFLGQALANIGLFDSAEKELILSVDLGKGQMKEAHRILAIIYGSRGDKKRAAENLEIYLRLAPTAPDAEKLRARLAELKTTS